MVGLAQRTLLIPACCGLLLGAACWPADDPHLVSAAALLRAARLHCGGQGAPGGSGRKSLPALPHRAGCLPRHATASAPLPDQTLRECLAWPQGCMPAASLGALCPLLLSATGWLAATAGLYQQPVAILDFASLYPSLFRWAGCRVLLLPGTSTAAAEPPRPPSLLPPPLPALPVVVLQLVPPVPPPLVRALLLLPLCNCLRTPPCQASAASTASWPQGPQPLLLHPPAQGRCGAPAP